MLFFHGNYLSLYCNRERLEFESQTNNICTDWLKCVPQKYLSNKCVMPQPSSLVYLNQICHEMHCVTCAYVNIVIGDTTFILQVFAICNLNNIYQIKSSRAYTYLKIEYLYPSNGLIPHTQRLLENMYVNQFVPITLVLALTPSALTSTTVDMMCFINTCITSC